MERPDARKTAMLLFFFGLVVLVILLMSIKSFSDEPGVRSVSNDISGSSRDDHRSSTEDNGFSSRILDAERPCEECHSGFYPFRVEVDQPGEVQQGQAFEYNIIVSNSNRDTKHTVSELEATLTGIGDVSREPYSNDLSGSIRRFGISTHTFPVEACASYLLVSLNGNSGIASRNDLDLRITSPSGREWTSSTGGMDEDIELEFEDICEGGTGEYLIEVIYISGIGSISYSINIDVNYAVPELTKIGEDLDTGDSYEFTWMLLLAEGEEEQLGAVVSGTVSYQHSDGDLESYRYQLEVNSNLVLGSSSGISTNPNLKYGRYMGLISITLLFGVLITSYSETSRKSIAKIFKMTNPRRVHCYIAVSILLMALIHSILLLNSNYTIGATPSLYGSAAFILFAVMGIEGFNREKIVAKIGKKRWKQFHLVLAGSITLIVLYHALVFGNHFWG